MAIRVFISYAWMDNRIGASDKVGDVTKIKDELQTCLRARIQGAHVFIDYNEMRDEQMDLRIQKEISRSDFFIVFLSNSYLLSQNTLSEYTLMRQKEREICGDNLKDRNRIFLIYFDEIDELHKPDPISFVLRDIQGRLYRDFKDLRREDASSSEFRKAVNNIKDVILVRAGFAEAQTLSIDTITTPDNGFHIFDDKINNALQTRINRITERIQKSTDQVIFRGAVIDKLLDELEKEISGLNDGTYTLDISLGRSFMLRAGPIFQSASCVYALSLDSYSSFWLSPSEIVNQQAVSYTDMQPQNTFRLFVFSNAYNMLRHRKVLRYHYERYGDKENGGKGKVLFTSYTTWKKYLDNLTQEYTSAEDVDWLRSRTGADFALLEFTPLKKSYYEGTLDSNTVSFRSITLGRVHERIKQDLCNFADGSHLKGLDQKNTNNLGRAGACYCWSSSLHEDDDLWFGRVASLFPEYDLSDVNSDKAMKKVTHVILFSKRISKDRFRNLMQRFIPLLIDIEGVSRERLVSQIWYGSSNDTLKRPIDPRHGHPLRISNRTIEDWPHLLQMQFPSYNNLLEYYNSDRHSFIREMLYSEISDDLKLLLEVLGTISDEHVKKSIGQAIEETAAIFMKRMDFEEVTNFGGFRDVKPEPFGH